MSTASAFVAKSVSLLRDDYRRKLTRAVEALPPGDLWWRPNDVSNSAGNLLLHLRGNVAQWIIGGVGQRPYERDRPAEFAARAGDDAAALLARLWATVDEACEIIGRQTEASLLERRQIQQHDVSVLEAIYHVVEHFSTHTGQVILIAKARTGRDLELWKPVSVE